MSAADMIKRHGKTIPVTRAEEGSYNSEGTWVPGAATNFAVIASVQPISARERELLPEGTRQKEIFKVYTVEKLLAPRGPQPTGGDILTINGEKFLVTACLDYATHQSPTNTIQFYRSTAERLEIQ